MRKMWNQEISQLVIEGVWYKKIVERRGERKIKDFFLKIGKQLTKGEN